MFFCEIGFTSIDIMNVISSGEGVVEVGTLKKAGLPYVIRFNDHRGPIAPFFMNFSTSVEFGLQYMGIIFCLIHNE